MFTTNDFGAHLGQESLIAVGIFFKQVFCDHRTQDGITQVFQAFVVLLVTVGVVHRRLVVECDLEDVDLGRSETENPSQATYKNLVLGEIEIV